MRIEWVEIDSFRSFRTSGRIDIAPSRTVVVGKNNAGKSALLHALTLNRHNDRHRSPKTVASRRDEPPETRIQFGLMTDGPYIERFLTRVDGWFHFQSATQDISGAAADLRTILGNPIVQMVESKGSSAKPDFGLSSGPGKLKTWSFHSRRPKELNLGRSSTVDLQSSLISEFRDHGIFRFRAERMNISSGKVDKEDVLTPDASNLPTALHALQSGNRVRFAEFCDTVRRILPSIGNVQVPVKQSNLVEIAIWSHAASTMRDDLAVPLHACGTGVSQVLAMVYVLLTAEQPKTFLIDEPNSFLHPSAVFELLSLFGEHPQHQYVIATHSPEVIAAFEPERIVQLELEDGETRVTSLDHSDVEHQRRILRDVGARLSSVFGADWVLWVEGDTEEQAFPLIVNRFERGALSGGRILRVADTGSFDKRYVEASASLYTRLARGAALVPPAVGFLFDRERRSDEQIERIRARVPRVFFLNRSMTESYLLHAGAIAAVLSEDLGERVAAERVQEVLDAIRGTNEIGKWLESVDGAASLDRLFVELSEARVPFTKPGVPVRLVKWLLANEPAYLRPLFQEILDVLNFRSEAATDTSTPGNEP